MRSRTRSARRVVHLVDDPAVGEEDDAVGVGGGGGVVGDHDDGLAERRRRLSRRNASTSAPARESRLPVGSSAKMISGRVTRARAAATRCCWPPESWFGLLRSRSRRPTVSMTLSSHSWSGLRPAMSMRQRDVLERGQRGHQVERLEDEARPGRGAGGSGRRRRRWSGRCRRCETVPDVAASSPAQTCIRVDLPDPLGPMMAVNRPVSNATETPSRARTSASPSP